MNYLSANDLDILFDEKYGCLKNSSIITLEEYLKIKSWSINSGFFAFQIDQASKKH